MEGVAEVWSLTSRKRTVYADVPKPADFWPCSVGTADPVVRTLFSRKASVRWASGPYRDSILLSPKRMGTLVLKVKLGTVRRSRTNEAVPFSKEQIIGNLREVPAGMRHAMCTAHEISDGALATRGSESMARWI